MDEERQALLHCDTTRQPGETTAAGRPTQNHTGRRKRLVLTAALFVVGALTLTAVTLPIVHRTHQVDDDGGGSAPVQTLLLADYGSDDGATLESLLRAFSHVTSVNSSNNAESRVRNILRRVPLIDGHNDLAYSIRNKYHNEMANLHLEEDRPDLVTDLHRLKQGQLGGQFWSCYVSCSTQFTDAVRVTLDQCDTIWRFVDKYPDVFERVETAEGILRAFRQGKIASLIGVEGGHSIDSSLATLRQLYRLGVRYMTLTHTCNTPWADTSGTLNDPEEVPPTHGGLTEWGELVVKEMNRLGMLVDLSHVAKATQVDALQVSDAPVIFSHSSAWALCHHNRNVHDDVLRRLYANGGLVMVSFVPQFTSCPPFSGEADVSAVADHIEHIRKIAGVNHVGIGSDFEGVNSHPKGLEDVSKFPSVFIELARRGWSDLDLAKLAGLNLIRVFKEVEQFRDQIVTSETQPIDQHIPDSDLPPDAASCRPDF